MKIKFAEGIEVMIDDEKLVNWQQSNDNSFIKLAMRDGSGYRNFEIDVVKKKLYEVK